MDVISEMFLIGTITWNVWENYSETHYISSGSPKGSGCR
jgi:hypothetical protein